MEALDVIGLAGSSTTYGAVRAGFAIKARLALPGGFGNASVEGNRRALGEFPIQTDEPSRWEPQKGVCYVCGVPPCCFAGGTAVVTARGVLPIESVAVGDEVLTHKRRWRRVVAVGSKVDDTVRVGTVECTADHRWYATPRLAAGSGWRVDAAYHGWTPAADLCDKAVATPAEADALDYERPPVDETPDFWRVVGRWVGDGWVSKRGTVYVCESEEGAARLVEELRAGLPTRSWSRTDGRGVVRFECNHKELAGWLVKHFGRGAAGKTLPGWLLGRDADTRRAFFSGYVAADGNEKTTSHTRASSVSRPLAVGVRLLAAGLGWTTSFGVTRKKPVGFIEGRAVRQRDSWNVDCHVDDGRYTVLQDGMRWTKCRRAPTPAARQVVYDLEVDEDSSYTADGFVVHNSGFSGLNTAKSMAAKHGSKAANFRGAASPINECQRELVKYAARCTGGDGKAGPEVVCFESVAGAYHQGLDLMREYHALLKAATGQPYVLHHLLHNDASLGGAQDRKRYFWVAARVPFGVDYERPTIAPPSYEEVMGDLVALPLRRGPTGRLLAPSRWARSLADTEMVTWHEAFTTEKMEQSLSVLLPLWPPGTSVSAPLARYAEANDGASPPGTGHRWWKDGRLNMFESNMRRVANDRRGCWVIPGGCETKFAHWSEPRFLTVREFARLMSLPDSWSFDYTKRIHDASNMIAKACPVTSAEWVARAARAAVEGKPQTRGAGSLLQQVGEDEFVMDVTDEWKKALPLDYDQKAHTQGSYANLHGVKRPGSWVRRSVYEASGGPQAVEAPKALAKVPRARPDVVLETRPPATAVAGAPMALPEWGGGPVLDFWQFVHERMAVWGRRASGATKPWSADPVMVERFFTNCFRELDPGTALARRIAEEGADRPAWEQLWNLVLYRRFNREETWREAIGGYVRVADYLGGGDQSLAGLVNQVEDAVKAYRADHAVFTTAHQVFPLNDVVGDDLVARIFTCAYEAVDEFPDLTSALAASCSMREAFQLMRKRAGAGIASFLGWQLTLDATLGPRPLIRHSTDEWAPVTVGSRVGLIIKMNWPRLGLVRVGGWPARSAAAMKASRWPELASVPPKELEEQLLQMRDAQDQEFEARGLDFQAVAAPGHPRLTLAALEHSLCEWMKYVSIATGMPHSRRIYDRGAEGRSNLGGRVVRRGGVLLPVDEGVPSRDGNNDGQGRARQVHIGGRNQARSSRPEARRAEVELQASVSGDVLRSGGGPGSRSDALAVAGRSPQGAAQGDPGERQGSGRDEQAEGFAGGADVREEVVGPDGGAAAPAQPRAGQAVRRRRVGPEALGVEVDPDWALLPGPTALARILLARGATDDIILAATSKTFGKRTAGPHLFTRTDLAQLRARVEKRGSA